MRDVVTAPQTVYNLPAPASDAQAGAQTRILLIEDCAADADIIADYFDELADGVPTARVERVGRLRDAMEALGERAFDVVLLDLSLPDAHDLEGLGALQVAHPEVPVVVMTGLSDDRMALMAVKAGAQDYLSKALDGGRVVRRAVRYAIERQRLQRQLTDLLAREREARAVAERAAHARDEMLSIVSHDLRSPLSTIAMAASSITRVAPSETPKLATTILRSSEWALRIIRDLVDVAAIEAGRLSIYPEPMTLQAIAEMIHSLFAGPAEAAGLALTVERQDAPRWITADVDRIVQAVGNLLANAMKFTPAGGDVGLRIEGGADGTVRFVVSDTGPGIPEEHLPHVFDRFWQGRKSTSGGAGLGLAIADGIARSHGGRITVSSTPGSGSTFVLTLPAGARA